MTDASKAKRPYLSLSIKLVSWVLLFSSLFTLLMTITLVVIHYNEEKKDALDQLHFAATSYNKTLANSVWDLDMDGIHLQLEALTHFPMVGHVILSSNIGPQIHRHKNNQELSALQREKMLFWQESLVMPTHPGNVVGQLLLYVDESALHNKVAAEAVRILIAETLKGFLLGMIIIFLVSRLVTRHLADMVKHTAAMIPTALDQPIVLRRRRYRHADELDQLGDAFNQLHRDLAEYIRREELQAQLVAQEKLVSLGALVAGVAHELNTPIGNCLMMTSVLQEKTSEINQRLQLQRLQRNDLVAFLSDAEEASIVIMRGLGSAAHLVNSFKQVAVDRATAQQRPFNLSQIVAETIATMMSQIRSSGHEIKLVIPADISMNSYPGPLGQVIANMISNALIHAFEGRKRGEMLLSAKMLGNERVQIDFCDNGIGISEQNLKRVFDPFFTTKMGQGGTGLGLSISYNIVTSLLQGYFTVQSTVGGGTVFTMDMPLVVAEHVH